MPQPLNILSIDGGGIRGVIPARVLADIEDRARAPIADLFDLVAGTSTGGLLALALTVPKPDANRGIPASELVSLYFQHGRRIFPATLGRRFKVVRASHDPLAKVLTEYVGTSRLSDSLIDVIIPAYEMERRQPFFFKSWRAKTSPQWDFLAVDAGLAACSAPTFFDPWKIGPEGERTRAYTLMDGGVFANNPALCAIVETKTRFPGRPINILSLGTGDLKAPAPEDKVKAWSIIDWGRKGFGIVSEAVSEAVNYHVQRLENVSQVRLQADVPPSAEAMDNAATENVTMLISEADTLIRKRRTEIDGLVGALRP